MPLKIVRNDITKMDTQAIVNTANDHVSVGTGCDYAVYNAAGYEELLNYRKENIGFVEEGSAFITPGFKLKAEYIIHAVSPLYMGGNSGEEEKLRSCYKKSLQIAKDNNIKSISFPLISTGGFGYPKEEGMRIAIDEINAFLMENSMDIYLVVFDNKSTNLGKKLYPKLDEYIDLNYVNKTSDEEYESCVESSELIDRRIKNNRENGIPGILGIAPKTSVTNANIPLPSANRPDSNMTSANFAKPVEKPSNKLDSLLSGSIFKKASSKKESANIAKAYENVREEAHDEKYEDSGYRPQKASGGKLHKTACEEIYEDAHFSELHESKLEERMKHLTDTYSEYLMYLIKERNMENAEVWRRAIVDKKVFSKIKNNPNYHPNKMTALCLCVGAKLNLDESRDLLARAGYALSPCDKTDIIFSYFIENEIYDMVELDIQLEEHGLPCIIA